MYLINWSDTPLCNLLNWSDTPLRNLLNWSDTPPRNLINWSDYPTCALHVHPPRVHIARAPPTHAYCTCTPHACLASF